MTAVRKSNQLDILYWRDGGVCWICHRVTVRENASRDHLIPRSKGGPDNLSNYAIACRPCNNERGNQDMLSQRSVEEIISECQGGRCHECGNHASLVRFSKVATWEGSREVLRGFCAECQNVQTIPQQRISKENFSGTMSCTKIKKGHTIRFNIGSVHCGTVTSVHLEGNSVIVSLRKSKRQFIIPIKHRVELVK